MITEAAQRKVKRIKFKWISSSEFARCTLPVSPLLRLRHPAVAERIRGCDARDMLQKSKLQPRKFSGLNLDLSPLFPAITSNIPQGFPKFTISYYAILYKTYSERGGAETGRVLMVMRSLTAGRGELRFKYLFEIQVSEHNQIPEFP